MIIHTNAPSWRAAAQLIAAAAGRHHERLGLADHVDIECCVLDRDELVEVVAVLATAIQRLSRRPVDDLLEALTGC